MSEHVLGPLATLAMAQVETTTMQAPPAQAPRPPGEPATTTQPGSTVPVGGPPGGPPQGSPGGLGPIWILALVMLFFVLLTTMSGRKERKRRDAMIGALKRGDKVQTTAGIIGTVADLSDTEMTLRVDEASNTRIRFARSAVQSMLREGAGRSELEAKPKSQTPTAT